MKRPDHVVVLGAGPAGLAVAHELTANGVRVTVLERNSYVGGLCRTIEHKGYRFDLGGHRWFTKNEHLNNWFRHLMTGELTNVKRISRIYYDGKYFNYPIQFRNIVDNTSLLTIVHATLAFIWSALRFAVRTTPVQNMKDAYVAQFGTKLYDMFFRRYSEKVWGLPCEKLSPDWVAQRSKGLSIWSLVRNALSGDRNRVTSLVDEFMYPRLGYARIPEKMAQFVENHGGEINLNHPVTRIVFHGPNMLEVFSLDEDGERGITCDAVVSTIPLGFLAQILEPPCDESVKRAAQGLKFRDLITVDLMLRRERVTGDTWLYIQDENVLFGRMHEPKNWSSEMVPDGNHTSLVLECFCSYGDELSSLSDAEIVERCVRDLVDKLGFISDAEVEGSVVIRTRNAYPVYDLTYDSKISAIKAWLATREGVHIVGRGGTFRYNNADHSIEMGLMLGRRLLGEQIDPMAVNTEQEYHEERSGRTPERSRYIFNAPDRATDGTDEPGGENPPDAIPATTTMRTSRNS